MRQLMNCPQCGETMVSELFGSAWVEVCQSGCKGIWFDAGELAKLDARGKGAGPALGEALGVPPTDRPAGRTFECPLCSVAMGHYRHELAPEVEYDECPGCAGLFLRAGELARLRRREATPTERRARLARARRARERAAERTAQRRTGSTTSMAVLFSVLLSD